MSFVINKSQLKSIFDSSNKNPGPGSYSNDKLLSHSAYYAQQQSAPFNSSKYKQSIFDQLNEQQASKIGPGSYLKLAQPSIVKHNRVCTSSFQSKVERFSYNLKVNCKSNNNNNIKNNNSKIQPFQSKDGNQNSQTMHNKYQKPLIFYDKQHLCNRIKSQIQSSKSHQSILKQKKQNLNKLREHNQTRKINSIVNIGASGGSGNCNGKSKQIRIILSNPKNTQNLESFYINADMNLKQFSGPGQYDISQSLVMEDNASKKLKVIDWSKYKEKRFKRAKSEVSANPGPGHYQLLNQTSTQIFHNKGSSIKHPRLTSSFSYGGIRSYMDTIIYKTQNPMKAKIMQQKNLKSKQPGPGDYQTQTNLHNKRQSFYYGKQIIGSSVQRFPIQQEKIKMPGPGYYVNAQCKYKYSGLIKQVRSKIFGKSSSLVAQNKVDFVPLQKQLKAPMPSRSFEEPLLCTLKERCTSKAGSISQEKRFQAMYNQGSKGKSPGPGQYLKSSMNARNSSMIAGNSSNANSLSNNFKSSSTMERQPFKTNKQSSNLPFYQIGKQDIAYRTEKKRQNIQSLKKVAIEKPGFDSNVQRFSSDKKQQNIAKSAKKLQQNLHHSIYQRDQIDYNSFKPYQQKSTYASVFRSTTQRQPFILKKQNPGPGSYQYSQDPLNKKSFNSQYKGSNKKQKIVPKSTQKSS